MSLISWSDSYATGIQTYDDQHKKLIKMINDLHDAMRERKGQEVLGKVLDELVSYTASHFRQEEEAMSKNGYPEFAAHKQKHEDLVKQVLDIQSKFKAGSAMITVQVMNFLKNWLSEHIVGTDKKYGPFLSGKGVK